MGLKDYVRKKHFKVFWQVESTDCGPACLQMICNDRRKPHSQQYTKDTQIQIASAKLSSATSAVCIFSLSIYIVCI